MQLLRVTKRDFTDLSQIKIFDLSSTAAYIREVETRSLLKISEETV
jgi:hypothetical protein